MLILVTGYLEFVVDYFGYMLRMGHGHIVSRVVYKLRLGHGGLQVVYMLLGLTQHQFTYILQVDLMFDGG